MHDWNITAEYINKWHTHLSIKAKFLLSDTIRITSNSYWLAKLES